MAWPCIVVTGVENSELGRCKLEAERARISFATSGPCCCASCLSEGMSKQLLQTGINHWNALSIVVHDNGHATHIETIGFGHHALSESISDMIRTKEGGNDNKYMEGEYGKDDSVPS